MFNLQEINQSFMDGFGAVHARRRWEEEYKEEHGIMEEREKTIFERMAEAGLYDRKTGKFI